ncbi:MAG: hypothetical protein H6599_06165 [Flavobacteriales bacterium]|nr:hypothetical protein [Flavobacteriales bacterium]
MKTPNFKVLTTVAGCLLAATSFSQNWRLGGNGTFPPPNAVNATNNILGTDNTANFPLRIQTNGTQRVLIDNGGVGVNTGRVVFGNDLPNNFTPQARLHLHQTGGVVATRFTNDNTGFTANDGLAIGIL